MSHSCTLCGSREWPDADSSCPLCRVEKEVDHDSNDECLLKYYICMMEQDIETIREIITKGGTAADILKFLDTPNA